MVLSFLCNVEGGSCQLIGSPVYVDKVNQSRICIKISDADKNILHCKQYTGTSVKYK